MRTKQNYHIYLTFSEVKKLLMEVDNIKIETMFRIGIDTGMRVNDFALIEIHNIDLEKRQITFWQQKKRNKHTVILENLTVSLIKKYLKTLPKKQRYLFENKQGKPYSYFMFEDQLSKWCKKIGIDDPVSWRMLRRTYTKLSIKVGRTKETIAKQLDIKEKILHDYYPTVNYKKRIENSNILILGDFN